MNDTFNFDKFWKQYTRAFKRHTRRETLSIINEGNERDWHWRKKLELINHVHSGQDAIFNAIGSVGKSIIQ